MEDSGTDIAIRAVVMIDMVGSTALRDRLGDDRADRLRRDHYGLLRTAIAAHRGRVLHWTGDGVQADFASASQAVGAALDVQRAVDRYGHDDDAVAPFQVRIGVAVGEVIVEADDDMGLAVVEAVRLEAMCAAGEILVTELVAKLGRRRVDASFEEVGERRLKGLDRPVSVWRVVDTFVERSSRALPKALALDRRFPVVGRASALAVATQGWQHACSGLASAVLITGRSGMGKSRLLAQFADRAHLQGALVVAGVCDAELTVPYQPFAMALQDLAADDLDVAAALGNGDGPLGPLFGSRPQARIDEQGLSARSELFDAVAALIQRLAEARPLLLVLEDLQWADSSTVLLLRHLVQHTRDARVLLLATYRPDEVTFGHPLHGLLAEISSSSRLRRVELTALIETDVVEMIVARVPDASREAALSFARRVTEESAGSPFFIVELLHHLSLTGELQRIVRDGEQTTLPIPDSVREVVGQRLARLSGPAREVLSAASLVGLTFDLDLVALLLERSKDEVLESIEEVVRATLLHEIGVGRFAFSHAIVRSALVEPVSATRRAFAHRRIAESIEQLGRADHDELAHHWQLAGVTAKAMEHVEKAARRDLQALAYESAADRYRVLLEHHRQAGATDDAALARAALGLGLAQRGVGDPGYLPFVEEAGRYARQTRDVDLMADAALASLWPGTFFLVAQQVEPQLVELCEDALASIADDDRRRIALLTTLASHLSFDPDRTPRAALLAEASQRAQEIGDPQLIGNVLAAEYLSLWDPTTFDRRAAIAGELARTARASGDPTLVFLAAFFAGFCAIERGDIADARAALPGMAIAAKTARNFYFTFLTERLALTLDIFTGEPGVQARVDDLAVRYGPTHADTDGTWAVQTAGLAIQSGTLHTMVDGMRSIITTSNVAPSWLPAFGLALAANGDREEAEAVLDNAEEPLFDYFWLTSMQSKADLAAALGRSDWCRRLYDVLLPFAPQVGITASGSLCYGFMSTTLGVLALGCGDTDAAIAHLHDALRRSLAVGATFESVKSRRALAEAMLLAGCGWTDVEALVDDASSVARDRGYLDEQARLILLRKDRGGMTRK